MGINVVKGLDGDLRKLTWTVESEWVLTWLTEFDGDQRKRKWTIEGEWVST